MFNRTPRWVTKLPDGSINKELLKQLANSSRKPLETPREMNFDIRDFNSRNDAQEAAKKIEARGWLVQIDVDHKNPEKYWVSARKAQYRITESDLFEDERFFLRIAALYSARFDGWYAMLVK